MTPFHKLCIAACVVACSLTATLVSLHPSTEADLFFHLELGHSVLTHGSRIVPEPHAFADFEPTCVVPAWLWDILAYGVYTLGGFSALSLMNLLFALACTLMIARLAWIWRGTNTLLGWATVTIAAVVCISTRFALRPQTLAIALLAGYLLWVHDFTLKTERQQRARGVGLVLLAVAWAQLHGSFVLAPVLFAIVVVGARLEARDVQPRIGQRTQLVVFAALLLTQLSSAAGLDVIHYIVGHGYGDAVQFIAEMQPPSWAALVSFQGAIGKALVLLWALSLFGLTRESRFRWIAIALALLGHVLLSRAQRFVAEDAILCIPLALSGAANIGDWAERVFHASVRRALAACCVLALSLLLVADVRDSLRGYGGRFGLGIDRTAFPELATSYLKRMPEGARVLTAFGAGPAIGFWSRGKLRTYVDGRTPMYFDDADYAVARDVFSDPNALDRAIRRFGVKAAVVERAHGVCDLLSKRWHPVVIEGLYSTFVPRDVGTPLRGVDPCGPEFVRMPRQQSDLDNLGSSIEQLARLGGNPFIDMLRAEHALRSGNAQPAQLTAWIEASASAMYVGPHRRLRIAALAAAGSIDAAYELMREALHEGDATVLVSMMTPQLGALDLERARELVELGVKLMGEGTRPATRVLLATVCMQQGDADCVRYNALRAAAHGAPNVEVSLAWLAQHAKTERMRADSRAWLQLIRAERAATPE